MATNFFFWLLLVVAIAGLAGLLLVRDASRRTPWLAAFLVSFGVLAVWQSAVMFKDTTASQVLFSLFGAAVCFGALGVVLSQNVVRMAFWLIVSLGSTSGLFFLLNADFVGAVQLLVYVGGTLVLLIFGVMLTASGPYVTMKTSPTEWVAAAVVSSLLLGLILVSAFGVDWQAVDYAEAGNTTTQDASAGSSVQEGTTLRPLGWALLGLRPDKDLQKPGEPSGVGYLLPFEIVSVHLLVVLIGAAYLARAKRRVDQTPGTTAL